MALFPLNEDASARRIRSRRRRGEPRSPALRASPSGKAARLSARRPRAAACGHGPRWRSLAIPAAVLCRAEQTVALSLLGRRGRGGVRRLGEVAGGGPSAPAWPGLLSPPLVRLPRCQAVERTAPETRSASTPLALPSLLHC